MKPLKTAVLFVSFFIALAAHFPAAAQHQAKGKEDKTKVKEGHDKRDRKALLPLDTLAI